MHYYNDEVKKDEMGRSCNMLGAERNAQWNLVGKQEGKRPPVKPRRRLEDNIKIYLREI
jgi:hypothetical protein